MAKAIVAFENDSNSGQSPFDQIRRIDDSGAEYWLARELMPYLEYVKWQRFNGVIDKAKRACENARANTDEHFTHLPGSVSASGRTGDNYKLSRYACYLVAMNGDPDKEAIAAAQTYFAIKVREAEIAVPQISKELQKMELENENMKLKLQVYEAQQKTLAAAGMLALTAPAIVEAIICPGVTIIEKIEEKHVTVLVDSKGHSLARYDGLGITDIQRRFGFSSTKQAWSWLESIGYGKNSGLWRDEKVAVDSPRFPSDRVKDLDARFRQKKGTRQQLFGELG